MGVAFRAEALPARIRPLVAHALAEGEGHEDALAAIEDHLAGGGARTPDLLAALAVLTFEDAASLVLSRLREAAERAVALLDEALACEPADPGALARVRALYARALERERRRERRLRARLSGPGRARPTELAELAHRMTMRGEDEAEAFALMETAAAAAGRSDRDPNVRREPENERRAAGERRRACGGGALEALRPSGRRGRGRSGAPSA
jgi:hypothetical protein